MPGTLTLGQFVKELTAIFEENNIAIPFKNERPWHFLFYELKKDKNAMGRPAFFDELEFDWDGPFPKSQELSNFLHSLHWNASVSASNPHYETISLSEPVRTLWLQRYEAEDANTKLFFATTLDRATREFGHEFAPRIA
jgi:hypothetical protein